jgi:hypothetical protein
MKTYYVGMDVHRARIVIVVLNGAGKVVMQSVIETGAERVRGFLKQLRGKVYVTFEEGTQANWLHEVVRPLVTEVVVCDPRHNKLMQSGNKSDRVDAQKLAELLRLGSLKAVYHGDNGVGALKELVRSSRFCGKSFNLFAWTSFAFAGAIRSRVASRSAAPRTLRCRAWQPRF